MPIEYCDSSPVMPRIANPFSAEHPLGLGNLPSHRGVSAALGAMKWGSLSTGRPWRDD